MSRIVIVVPASRKLCGRLVLVSSGGKTLLGPMRVLARASRRIARRHGNPACARDLPFGDPPAGSYAAVGSLPPSTRHARRPRRFGRLGALLFEPRAGESLAAFTKGRRVFTLHGGPRDRAGRLRPTRGGLRLSNRNLAALFRAVNTAQEQGDPLDGLDIVDVPDADAIKSMGTAPRWGGGALDLGLVLGGLAGAIQGRGEKVGRRQFIASAVLLVGGLRMTACDRSSPCDPSACDPDAGTGGHVYAGSDAGSKGGGGAGAAGDGCSCDDEYAAGGGVG